MRKASNASFSERKKAALYTKSDIWQGRAARLLVILLLCAQPLYFSRERYIGITYHKWAFFVFCMVIVLLCIIAIWVYRMTRTPRLLPRDKLSYFDWAVLVFAAVTILSALLSPYRHTTSVWIGIQERPAEVLSGRYDGAITQLLYVAVYFIVSRWYKPNEKDFAFAAGAASLVALIGILQFYGMDIFRLWPNDIQQFRQDNFFFLHFRTTLGNVNIVSTYTSVAALLCGFLFLRKKSKFQLLWLAGSALSFWMRDIAGSDSGLVGIAVTMFFALPFIIESGKVLGRTFILLSSWVAVFTLQRLLFEVITVPRHENLSIAARDASTLLPFVGVFVLLLAIGFVLNRKGKEPDPDAPPKWKLGVILIAGSLVIGVVGVEIMGREEAQRGEGFAGRLLFEAREVMHGNISGEMGSGRAHIWRHAFAAVPDNPIIGSGPDTFEFAFPEDAQGFMGARFDTAHNEYIQILVTHGILGVLAYMVFLGGVLLTGLRKAFKNPLAMAALAGFFGYCVQAVFNISLPIVSMMLWVFAGMLANKNFIKDPQEESV